MRIMSSYSLQWGITFCIVFTGFKRADIISGQIIGDRPKQTHVSELGVKKKEKNAAILEDFNTIKFTR